LHLWPRSNRIGSDTTTSWIDDVVLSLSHLILISSLPGFAATTCSAGVITAIGDNAANAAQWRTQTTKAINPAGNNIYGNDGYVMFATEPINTSGGAQATGVNPFTFSGTLNGVTATTLIVMPTYVSSFTQATSPSTFNNVSNTSGNANFDDPSVPGGSLRSGVGYESESGGIFGATNQPIFSFTVNSRVPAAFTVGLFFTTSGGFSDAAGLRGGGVTIPVTITKTTSNDSVMEALFFAISGAAAGDTYTVVGSGPGGSPFGDNIDIMGITFDSTPEPTTLAGCAAVSLGLIWLSRRRKKPGRLRTIATQAYYLDA
jgi:hypothetical protein